MSDLSDLTTVSTTELRYQALLIEENLQETGRRSAYAHDNLPRLKAIKAELKRRGESL